MNKQAIIAFVEEMIDALTLRRVALLTILATFLITIFVLFENRAAIFALIYKTSEAPTAIQWELSNTSKNQIVSLTNVDPISIVVFSDVDLKKNRRITKFYYAKDAGTLDYITPIIARLLPSPLFDYDAKNTEQMVAMLNNEFKCVPSVETVNNRIFPELARQYPITCRIAVPPFFGEFAGYITLILNRKPTPFEFDSIKIEANRLAIEVYLRDISKRATL